MFWLVIAGKFCWWLCWIGLSDDSFGIHVWGKSFPFVLGIGDNRLRMCRSFFSRSAWPNGMLFLSWLGWYGIKCCEGMRNGQLVFLKVFVVSFESLIWIVVSTKLTCILVDSVVNFIYGWTSFISLVNWLSSSCEPFHTIKMLSILYLRYLQLLSFIFG